MSIYKYLKESLTMNSLKDSLINVFHEAQNLILEYILVANENESGEVLDDLQSKLNKIVDIFNTLGYTYEPETVPDVDEDTFKHNLENYKEELSYLLNNFDEALFEQFNVQTKYILNLIEVHRTNFIKEGEVLIDEEQNSEIN